MRYSFFIALYFFLSPALLFGAFPTGAQDANEHQLLVQGLRSRGLYRLADQYCIDRLAGDGVGQSLQADLVVEQILTRTAQAMSAGESTEEAWGRVVFPGKELLATAPEHPRRFLVQLQMALVDAARAKSIQRQVRFGIRSSADVPEAIALFENCRRNLELLQREITQAIPRALQRPPGADELSADRMQALSASVNYQLASCLTEIAGMYEANDRLNRIDALNMVLERVEQVRRQTGVTSGLNQACELLRIEALQLAGSRAAAQQELQKTYTRQLTPENRQKYWQLVLNQPDNNSGTIRIDQELLAIESRPDNDPETEIAVLQFLVRRAKSGGAATGLEAVRTWADRVQSRFGSAWGRIANRLLLEAAGESVAGADTLPDNGMAVDLAIRAAENALAEKRTDEAIEAFRNAASKLEMTATDDGGIRQAFQLKVRIADLLAGENNYPAAASELRTISERFVSHELAAAVHLRAVWYAQRLVRADQPESHELYQSLLQNQIERWSATAPADQARLWRASLNAASQQWQSSVNDCLGVDPAGSLAPASAADTIRYMNAWLASLDPAVARSEGMRLAQPVSNFANRACNSGSGPAIGAGWKLRGELCGLGLRFGFLDLQQVRSMLDSLPSPDSGVEPAVLDSCVVVLAAAEVLGSGNPDRLKEQLERLGKSGDGSSGSLAFLGMTADADRSSQDRNLLRVQLEMANRLAESIPPGDQLEFVRLNIAQLHLALKEYAPAAAILEPLARALPNRMDVQLANARALSETGGRQSDAMVTWRGLATRLAPQSEPWFEAKHEIARLLLVSGKAAEARQMLEFLNAVPPGWKDSKWASRLDALLDKCREAGNQ